LKAIWERGSEDAYSSARATGYDPRVVFRYLDVLVGKRQTWIEFDGLLRPRKKEELPKNLSGGFSPVNLKEERPMTWSVHAALLMAVTVGVLADIRPMATIATLILPGFGVKELVPAIVGWVEREFQPKEKPIQ
jgi:hypothetical protein